MVPQVGQKVGPYEILGRLGSGGMGLVFSAWDARLQRDVAIKLLREEFATPGMRSRFLQEARAASRLNHANICTVFDIGEQEGDPYLVMELLKGETIRSRITRGGISTEDLVCVATEVADALIVAHGHGIIHRDIKPANIILVDKPNGRFQTKVLDFGLAKIDDSMQTTRFDLTSAGTTVGTVAYMSPEQAKGETLDAGSDLFSLGVVLYEMATGELPFQGATSALVFVKLLGERPEPIRDYNPDIPKELDRVIMTLLEKKRSDRYRSASDLVEALHKIQVKRGGGTKSLWGSKPSKGMVRGETTKFDIPPTHPTQPTRAYPETSRWGVLGPPPEAAKPSDAVGPVVPEQSRAPEGGAARPSHPSEAFLRPVKRIVTSDPPQGARSRPEITPADAPPMRSAAPLGSSGTHSPARTPVPPTAPVKLPEAGTPAVRASDSSARPASSPPSQRTAPRPPLGRFKLPDLGEEEDPRRRSRSRPAYRAVESGAVPKAEGTSKTGRWIAVGLLVAVAAGGGFAWYQMHPSGAVSDVPTSLLLVKPENHTGDTTLDGLLDAGLLLDLKQSPHLSIYGRGDLALGQKLASVPVTPTPSLDDARHAAKAVGAANLAIGDIHPDGPSSYAVSVKLYDVASGKRLAESSEVAASREQMGGAVDRLASDVRSALGETGDSIGRNSTPLAQDATSNLEALQAYVNGELLKSEGQLDNAMLVFEGAVKQDSDFTQAYVQLADIYRRQNAEVKAAEAATKAQDTSAKTGTRTQALTLASYDINTLGDYNAAIAGLQQLCNNYPADVDAHLQLALAERLVGKFADSLATAQAVLKLSPYNTEANGDAELAMIGLGNASGAVPLERESQRAGQGHPGINALIALLTSANAPAPSQSSVSDRLGAEMDAASVLDAGGQFDAGLSDWEDIAKRARSTQELWSAASYALSHAALDRALASDCTTANGLLQEEEAAAIPAGPNALYSAGMAYAFCGHKDGAQKSLDALNAISGIAQSFVAQGYYIPNLTAAIKWQSGDLAGALSTLQAAKQNDALSLAPYLRGVIHVAAKQGPLALADFQAVMQQSGPTVLVTPLAYPMAQIGIARAYAASNDSANSRASYKKFLALWSNPDPRSVLVGEAQQRSK